MNRYLLRIVLLRLPFSDLCQVPISTTVLHIFEDLYFWRQKLLIQYPHIILPPDDVDFHYLYQMYSKVPHDSIGLDWCAKNNHMDLYHMIIQEGKYKPGKVGLRYLLEHGHLAEFLAILVVSDLAVTDYESSILIAIKNGHIKVVQYFLSALKNDSLYVDTALRYAQLEILDMFAEQQIFPTLLVLSENMSKNHTLCIKYLFSNYLLMDKLPFEERQKFINACALAGNDELLNFFVPLNCGANNISDLIIHNKLSYIPFSMVHLHGSIENLVKEYMDGLVYLECAHRGYLHILKMKPKFRLIKREIENIVYSEKDNLSVCKFLRKVQKNDFNTIEWQAARCKRVDKLDFLLSNKLTIITPKCLLNAIISKNSFMIDYLLNAGVFGDAFSSTFGVADVYCLNMCCSNGNLELLKRLIIKYNIYPDLEGVKNAAKLNRLNILIYLQGLQGLPGFPGKPVTKEIIEQNQCGLGTLRWLAQHKDYKVWHNLIQKKIKFIENGKHEEYLPFEL